MVAAYDPRPPRRVPELTTSALSWLIHHLDAEFGPSSFLSSTFADEARCKVLARVILNDPHRSLTELQIEPASLVSHNPTISLVRVSTLRGEAHGAVIHSGAKVLILRRSQRDGFMPGIEELPSGGVEDDESLLSAPKRELAEEIGWSGAFVPDPGFVTSFDYASGSGRKARQYTFALSHDGRPITLSAEHTSYRWLGPADVTDSDVTLETAGTIGDWATSRSRPQ